MYVKRLLARALRDAVSRFPAILVTGPRQAGKTTFLLHEAPKDAEYVTFDDPLERQFAASDPKGFLRRFGDRRVILDEIQYVLEILPYLKIFIDKDRTNNGKWLLTGSQHFHLMKNVTESLAGRVAILELLPFSVIELQGETAVTLESLIWNGGYPDPSLYPDKRDIWIRSYIQTYVERDLRQIQNVKDLRSFEAFVGVAAANHAQEFNTASLSRDLGITLPTIKSWAGVLEASYLCHFLPPYFKNYGKRVIKTPKFYFLDPAIVCTLTRQPDPAAALSGAMAGVLFEGMIVSEATKVFSMLGMRPDLYFWRSHDRLEVDLIMPIMGKFHAVEIKLTSTPTAKHLEPLIKFKKLAGIDASDQGLLVCRIERKTALPFNNEAIPWQEFPEWLFSKLGGMR